MQIYKVLVSIILDIVGWHVAVLLRQQEYTIVLTIPHQAEKEAHV